MGRGHRARIWRRTLATLLLAGCHGTASIVSVQGTGTIPDVDFGRVIVGESATLPVRVQNVAGDTFHITGAPSIHGGDASDFQVTMAPASTVPAGQAVSGTVAFAPQSAGARQAQLTVATS